jgi:hypothetical protein
MGVLPGISNRYHFHQGYHLLDSHSSHTFFSATDGILPVIFSDSVAGRGIATGIYVTHNEGTTWKSTTPLGY